MTHVRIGAYTPLEGVSWKEALGFWRFLDRETAFHTVWISDHLFPVLPGLDKADGALEGFMAASAAAAVTERLRLGVVAAGVTLRQAGVVAKMAATIDHVSEGRFELGLGAAWHGGEHKTFGVPFPPAKEREDMLEEAAEAVRLLFRARGPVDFAGRHVTLQRAPFAPRCVQQPHVPVIIGGGGERRTLRTAARHGDMANIIGGAATARRKFAVLDSHCAKAGRNPAEVARSVIAPIAITGSESEADAARRSLALFTGGDGPDDVAIGDAAHVRSVIQRYADAGVTCVMMLCRPPFEPETYRRISDEVVGAFA